MRFANVLIPAALALLAAPIGGAALAQETSAVDLSGLLPEVVEAVGELPAVTPGTGMDLAEAVRMAGERNQTVEIMRAEVEKSQWATAAAWAIIMPMVEASMSYVRMDHETAVEFDMSAFYEALGIPPPTDQGEPTVIQRVDNLSGQLSVSMSLINVQGWFTIAAAKSGHELAKLSFEQVREQLMAVTVQAFLAAMMSRSVIDFQQVQVNAAAHHLDFAMKKFRSGSGLKIDVIRAQTDLVKAKKELVNGHLAYESARDALGLLTGLGGLPVPEGEAGLSLDTARLAQAGAEDDMISQALSQRYDVKLQAAGLKVARESFTATWGGYLPTVAGGWTGTYQMTEPASFGSDDRSRWNIFLGLNVPIFQFNRIADIKKSQMAVKIAELKVDDTKLNVAKEVRDASRQYRTAVANEEISRQQCDLAREAYALVEAAYMAGAGSSLEVTDALSALTAAEVGLLTASLRVQIAAVNLHTALGGKVSDLVN